MRNKLIDRQRFAQTNERSTRKRLQRDKLGDLMYRLADLQAELGSETTAARREELKKLIAELTEKMLARVEGNSTPTIGSRHVTPKADAQRRRAR